MLRYFVAMFTLLPALAGELRLGTASVKITPPVGVPMGGSYRTRLSDGVLDDLHAKALVLEQDGVRVALVACDLVSLSEPVVTEARRLIRQATGLAESRVMLSATHTHSGPLIAGRGSRDLAFGAEMEVHKQYMAWLPPKIARSVQMAASRMRPARVAAALGEERSVSFNRRFLMKDGTVGWNPGRMNPNIVRPIGPIDPDLHVVYFDSPDGKQPLATYVNHALHVAVTSGSKFSSDYAGRIARLLGEIRSPEMLTIFTIGAAGNVNHINVRNGAQLGGAVESARIGTILAGTVLRTFDHLEPVSADPIQFRSEIVNLPLAPIQPGEVETARAISARVGSANPPAFLELVNAFKVIDVAARDGRPLEAEVHVITLGNQLAFVGLPGEIFTELGMAVKRASPFAHTIVASLAGSSLGYIPNRKAYPEGNYEPTSARCASGSGEMLVDTATRLLAEMHRNRR
ncbi:MAG: hypothetical protein L0271_16780 [Gemmatimonadetes bacterium]|nr:hypothetical protein [Gemmatimonadota bacterium]